jgi:hypothetical protein
VPKCLPWAHSVASDSLPVRLLAAAGSSWSGFPSDPDGVQPTAVHKTSAGRSPITAGGIRVTGAVACSFGTGQFCALRQEALDPEWACSLLRMTNPTEEIRKDMSFRILTMPFWDLSFLAHRPQTEVAAPW